jgi:cell division protein FtsW
MTRGEVTLFFPTAALLALGVAMVGSASARLSPVSGSFVGTLSVRESVFAVLGLILYFGVRKIPVAKVLQYSYVGVGFCLAGLAAVAVIGTTVDGGRRWIGVGPVTIQPSEFTKLGLIAATAAWIASAEREAVDWRRSASLLVPLIVVTLVIVKTEHDSGTAAVIYFSVLAMCVAAGIPRRTVYTMLLIAVVGMGYSAAKTKYQRQRLFGFLSPNTGWLTYNQQAHQSRIGFGAGGFWGFGYGNGREKWGPLANPHTDFIFSTIGEELGFLGAFFTLVGLGILLYAAWKIAMNARRRDGQLLAVGIATWFTIQVGMNVGSVTGLFPVTGVPLPLVSYGGTSLLVNLAALALLGSVSRETELTVKPVPSPSVRTGR